MSESIQEWEPVNHYSEVKVGDRIETHDLTGRLIRIGDVDKIDKGDFYALPFQYLGDPRSGAIFVDPNTSAKNSSFEIYSRRTHGQDRLVATFDSEAEAHNYIERLVVNLNLYYIVKVTETREVI